MNAMTKTKSDKFYDMRSIESPDTPGTTIIEPIGDLTPALSDDLQQTVRTAMADGRRVEISLRRVDHVSWAGLWRLASSLGDGSSVRFRGVLPRVRSLMREVGFGPDRMVD